jgi:hypothetical protein
MSKDTTPPPLRKTPFESFTPAETALKNLHTLENGFYLGDEHIEKHGKFIFASYNQGNVLILKDSDAEPTEMILRGIFQIDKREFYMTSDAGYKSRNEWGIEKSKPNCRLVPVIRDPSFNFTIIDFPKMLNNLHALENLIPHGKNQVLSVIHHLTGEGDFHKSIRISHTLFVVSLAILIMPECLN